MMSNAPSHPPTNADSVVALDRTIPISLASLEFRARDVESVAGTGDEGTVVRSFAALKFLIGQIDFDMRVLMRAMASDPVARVTNEKLLALVLRESISGVFKALGDLQRTARLQAGPFSDFIDLELLTAAQRTYKDAVREVADDRAFMQTLVDIRNEVAAHMFSDDNGIESAAAWVVSRSVMPQDDDAIFASRIFTGSMVVLRALHALDAALEEVPTS